MGKIVSIGQSVLALCKSKAKGLPKWVQCIWLGKVHSSGQRICATVGGKLISNQGDVVRDRSPDFRQRKNAALSIIRLTLIIASKWAPVELLRTAIDTIAASIPARDELASIVGGTSVGDTGLLGMAEILSYYMCSALTSKLLV